MKKKSRILSEFTLSLSKGGGLSTGRLPNAGHSCYNGGEMTGDTPASNMPLLKFLASSGAGSRRKMADAVREGRVAVNGQPAEDFRLPIDPTTDHVRLDGRQVKAAQGKHVYLIMNKPAGVLTTTEDERGRKSVLDLLPARYRGLRLYPVGRLDKDSTGLLLLTNDGEITNRLTHPRYEHDKEYLVRIEGTLTRDELRQLAHGVRLEDGVTAPAILKEVKGQTGAYSLTIHEGRKRQIRRMFAHIGYHVKELKRVRSGSLTLGNLREGEVRELAENEVRALTSGGLINRASTSTRVATAGTPSHTRSGNRLNSLRGQGRPRRPKKGERS